MWSCCEGYHSIVGVLRLNPTWSLGDKIMTNLHREPMKTHSDILQQKPPDTTTPIEYGAQLFDLSDRLEAYSIAEFGRGASVDG